MTAGVWGFIISFNYTHVLILFFMFYLLLFKLSSCLDMRAFFFERVFLHGRLGSKGGKSQPCIIVKACTGRYPLRLLVLVPPLCLVSFFYVGII